ncbi:23S rRNA (adenine(2030)-N(6))-methyltransferase RlmJ [Roseateles sp. BYS180W]|uniref:Ribosomal RNA large subunit methyltransferase J n=1 Tax=Roseateles rivi TaxID=3299028 RepID=A0ABW7FU48_9BURK
MLAYRHAFHAGNHADVLKHLVLAEILRYMNEKDKPYTLVDTHAGAGGYALDGRYAQKNAEYKGGISALYDQAQLPEPLAHYVELVRGFNQGGRLNQYPGSPAVARQLMRSTDRLRCYELHPTELRILEAYLADRPNTQVSGADGFGALRAELPPPSRRAVVLIDPPYEIKADYAKVVGALREAMQRFAEGTVAIWYPQLQLLESAQLVQRLKSVAEASAKKGWLHVRLSVEHADAKGFGMLGSGMFVVNPPFKLHDQLLQCLPTLVDRLGQVDDASYLLEQLPG